MTDRDSKQIPMARALTKEEEAQATELAEFFKPKNGIDRIDAYAKWIFASTSVVGTLGAGLSNAAFGTLSGFGKTIFSLALAFVGLSVACSALSLAPQWHPVNPFSRDSMMGAINAQFVSRRRFLVAASVFFAIALFLAGSAPLGSSARISWGQQPSGYSLTYSLSSTGKFEATLTGHGLVPGSSMELRLSAPPRDHSIVLPLQRTTADADGTGKMSIDVANVSGLKELVIKSHVVEMPGRVHEETVAIPITII